MCGRRLEHLLRFYSILDDLERSIGGARTLADCRGRMNWPAGGMYFFREAGETRSDTGAGPRVVRVGTHVLKAGGARRCGAACPHTGGELEVAAAITAARHSG